MIKKEIIFDSPKRIDGPVSWVGHIPFAFFLVETLRPKIFVELGVHTGNSYFAFCQAVEKLKIDTTCFGIDNWKGDQHAGFYEEKVYEEVKAYNDTNYKGFSRLLKADFDETLNEFEDNSIDLLHIDGYHTYEASKHDFEAWLPKMSKRGVMILHDTQMREKDFGVWKLWEEISKKYPSFEFAHSYGLGVVAVGNEVDADLLKFIKDSKKDNFVQKLFERLGNEITKEKKLQDEMNHLKKDLEHKHIHITNLEKIREDILNSTSWKITRPLRTIKSKMRGSKDEDNDSV